MNVRMNYTFDALRREIGNTICSTLKANEGTKFLTIMSLVSGEQLEQTDDALYFIVDYRAELKYPNGNIYPFNIHVLISQADIKTCVFEVGFEGYDKVEKIGIFTRLEEITKSLEDFINQTLDNGNV